MPTLKKQIKVKPGAKEQRIVTNEDGSLTVYLKSPPVDGKANAELIELMAETYRVSKSKVTIKLGSTSRTKLVEITIA